MRVEVVVTISGAEPSRAVGELRVLSPGARLRRAAAVMLAAVILAALIIPVPIVHLVGIPLILMLGIATAVRVSRSVAVLAPIQVACPRCAAINSLGGGLGLTTSTGPIDLSCESCRRQLQLTITASPHA